MPQLDLNTIPEFCRISVARACEFEQISRREIYNRMGESGSQKLEVRSQNEGSSPSSSLLASSSLAWALAANPGAGPKLIRIIDARSLSPPGRERWLEAQKKTMQVEASKTRKERALQTTSAGRDFAGDHGNALPARPARAVTSDKWRVDSSGNLAAPAGAEKYLTPANHQLSLLPVLPIDRKI